MPFDHDNVISVSGLTKIFRDFWLRPKTAAVEGLDLSIRRGEVYGLLGPNGSGKSTTLKMILGLLFPTRGAVTVFSRPPADVRVKSRIGFLPETGRLYGFLNARETLDFIGQLFRLPRSLRRSRTEELIEMVGLAPVASRAIGEYSKGMARRIALACALINDPDLLILDEPTAGLDPMGRTQFKELIRALRDRGKTVLLSSHLLADVEDLCDRVCILFAGKKRAEGSLTELLGRDDRMQITTDALDEKSLDELRKLLGDHGREIHDVRAPRDRLEQLFVRIVEAARKKSRTGISQLAEFLEPEPPRPEDIIASLTAGTETRPAARIEKIEPPAAAPSTDRVLSQLTAEGAEPEPTAPPPSPASDSGKPDRGLIDELTSSDPRPRDES